MVQSQEGIALENQILQLQSQVQQLQAGGGGNGGSSLGGSSGGGSSGPAPSGDNGGGTGVPSSVVTNLLTEVQQLQSQIQDLNGRVDTLQNQVNTQNAQIEKDISDLKFQMGGGTPGAPAVPGAPGTPPAANGTPGAPAALLVPSNPKPATPAASPKLALHAAQEAILHRNYPAAEQAARGILATAKGTPAGYQAQYILAQSLYGEGKPEDSAIAYDDTYNRDRSGAYAPGALLGLANSLAAIHQQSAACDTLASLNSQFPTPPKGMGPAIEAASRRAHCS
jgi:TolA-binding protein